MSKTEPPATRRSPLLGGTGSTRGRGRRTARAVDGASLLRLLTVTGIGTVLVTRLWLARTGYPQLGNGTFHVAHALWGGLLLLVGLATTLLFVAARRTAAVLGGIGLGLFIDEVGKLVSRQSDYFFPLAPALIYVVFAGLLVWSALWDPGRAAATSSAAQIAVDGLDRGLSPADRRAAERLLEGRDDRETRAVRELLACTPPPRPAGRHHTAWTRLVARARRTVSRPQVQETVLGLYLASRLVIPVAVVVQLVVLVGSDRLAEGNGAVGQLGALLGSLAGVLVSAGFAVRAARLWRERPLDSYRWFKSAALVDLLLVAVCNFAGSQWAALAFLPGNLLVLAMISVLQRSERVPQGRRGLLRVLAALVARVRLPTAARRAAWRSTRRFGRALGRLLRATARGSHRALAKTVRRCSPRPRRGSGPGFAALSATTRGGRLVSRG